MRRALAVVALAVTALVVLAFLVPLGLLVRGQARDRALSRAQRDAQSVASGLAVAASLVPGGELSPELADVVIAASGEPERITVFLPDGRAAGTPAASDNLAAARSGSAFTVDVEGGTEVLVPVSTAAGTTVVRAFASAADQRAGVAPAWGLLAGLGVVLVGVAVLVADRLGRSMVDPVRRLANAAHRLGEGDLDVRVATAGPPEVAEVSEAFNHLAGRLRELLVAERESVADLSHRLRTPLAALRLQAEAVGTPADREALLTDIDRLTRAVDRLIADARRPGDEPAPPADLAQVVRHRAAFWSVLAEEQERTVAVDVPSVPVRVALPAGELGALVDTLLENVFAHTPPGTPFRVAVDGSGPELLVEDEGPGLAARSVVDRGTSGSGSTGLGLDIVRRAAERSGGSLSIRPGRAGGVSVAVRFGTPPG